MQGDAALGEVASPGAGLLSFPNAEWGKPKGSEQPQRARLFIIVQAAPNLFYGNDTDPGFDALTSKVYQFVSRAAPPKRVDDDG